MSIVSEHGWGQADIHKPVTHCPTRPLGKGKVSPKLQVHILLSNGFEQ